MPQRKSLLVPLVIALGVALAAGAFWLGGGRDGPAPLPLVPSEDPRPAAAASPPQNEQLRGLADAMLASEAENPEDTTVVYPLELDLQLIAPAHVPKAEGVRMLGSGGTAQMRGRIANAAGNGVTATVTFAAGPNVGRSMLCDDEGRFGATDLYPGLSVVTVEGPGIRGSEREVRLRQNAEYLLNIGYGRPGSVAGRVFDEKGDPLADVEVKLDGQKTFTDAGGDFLLPAVTSGIDLFIELQRPGYARLSQRIAVTAAHRLADQTFRMQRAATLEIVVAEAIGGEGLAQVILLPEAFVHERSFPWHRINPIEVRPGRSVVVEQLPAQRLTVRLFHEGALADPPVQIVVLREGERQTLVLHLKPGPVLTGRALDAEGLVVPDARVRLEAPDRVAATLTYVGSMPAFFETEVMPTFPVALQEARTGADGRFVFSAYSKYAQRRYLVAESADGSLWGATVVDADAGDVTVQLDPVQFEKARLSVEFPGRYQGLPVRLAIQGEPRGKRTLGARELLEIPELPHGTWRMRARWHGSELTPGGYDQFEITGDTTRRVSLPDGAIRGQDEDTRQRATERP